MEEQELRHRLAVAEGNIAGLVAIIGALVRQLPEEQRLHLEARAEAMFEPLEAAMLGDAELKRPDLLAPDRYKQRVRCLAKKLRKAANAYLERSPHAGLATAAPAQQEAA
ncbi:hypothetical protein [Bordetella bronchiseptica]|uniref:hypothetical protein n=1 Tax=Bordetella bronchiseptica TaxID=518 RepID=UPI001376A23C|nr:hypothetical protein [Bordetella bronchiseptica]